MSPSVIKPVQEETASASSTRRVAQLLDRISLILFPIAFVARLAVDEQLDAWHIFVWVFLLILWLLRLRTILKKGTW